ncbi:50S ribosomal protein L9 [Candidatus Parcubacteria bacterium]|nr:50S ribosomal protein L9 [Candidatus Parcubacteria bacterium]MBI4385569.1 50S ribosomal protein L9 [Candidatus Parcubacteria bacterium]
MKVILLQDIENLGNRYDVKDVADGYARNFLLPRKLVKPASAANLKQVEELKKHAAAEAEQALRRTEELASQLDGFEIRIAEKISETGTFFGSITPAAIAAELKNKGFDVAHEQVSLEEHIKEPGEYDVVLNLEHGLEAQIKVIAEAEKQ